VNPTIDELLARVQQLSSQLDEMSEEDPQRSQLIAERDRLRGHARAKARSGRHPLSVEAETAMLVERLEEIDGLFVRKGYAEKHLTKGFSDPGAYSANINRKLADDNAAEIAEIEQRLAALNETASTEERS
jgi:hypothetical protein